MNIYDYNKILKDIENAEIDEKINLYNHSYLDNVIFRHWLDNGDVYLFVTKMTSIYGYHTSISKFYKTLKMAKRMFIKHFLLEQLKNVTH